MLRRASGLAAVAAASVLLLLVYEISYFYRHLSQSRRASVHVAHHIQAPIGALTPSSSGTAFADHESSEAGSHASVATHTPSANAPVALVVASLAKEDTTWIPQQLRDWSAYIYVVDDPKAPLTVPVNRGREAMVYLTFIIDNYYKLPEMVIFRHSARFQWHSDDPDYDGLALLQRLQLPYLRAQGYVNLRCAWAIGCPVEIRPFIDEGSSDPNKATASIYKRAFEELLPGTRVPETVGLTCCAEFAATREVILARDVSEYKRMREWIINTDISEHTAGVVFEYLWHIIFGKEPVHCPAEGGCYCKLFGLCDCEETGSCDKYYNWPKYSTLPQEWPYKGWDGESRNYTPPVWR